MGVGHSVGMQSSSLINPRHACAARVMVVAMSVCVCVCVCVCGCVSVCLSVKSHLTSGASVHHENAATYSAGNEDQKICCIFSENAPLQRSSTPSLGWPYINRPFFLRITRMLMTGWLASCHLLAYAP